MNEALPTVRWLQRDDLGRGLLTTLDSLRRASDMPQEDAERIFDIIKKDQNHLVAVAVLDGYIVGTATLLVEQKFIHGGGLAGHIEDVAVSKEHQRRGIGGMIVRFLLEESRRRGCYKTILDCEDDLILFYEGLGFSRHSNGMRHDHAD